MSDARIGPRESKTRASEAKRATRTARLRQGFGEVSP